MKKGADIQYSELKVPAFAINPSDLQIQQAEGAAAYQSSKVQHGTVGGKRKKRHSKKRHSKRHSKKRHSKRHSKKRHTKRHSKKRHTKRHTKRHLKRHSKRHSYRKMKRGGDQSMDYFDPTSNNESN